MKKILVTGKYGQVGWELCRSLSTLGEVVGIDQEDLDLCNPEAIRSYVRALRPDIIVNPAAYTAVDPAETEKQLAHAINAEAPEILATEAKKLNALFVHYSTDYVFDGDATLPYLEEDPTSPKNVYGNSKRLGEEAVLSVGGRSLLFRTSWVYGARGKNFLLTMLKLAKERDQLKIVEDQVGAPTWSRSLAEATAQALLLCLNWGDHQQQPFGLYHMTSAGTTNWREFAETIFALYHKKGSAKGHSFAIPKILGIKTEEYPTPASRPKFSLLNNQKLYQTFGLQLPHWKNALDHCIADLLEM